MPLALARDPRHRRCRRRPVGADGVPLPRHRDVTSRGRRGRHQQPFRPGRARRRLRPRRRRTPRTRSATCCSTSPPPATSPSTRIGGRPGSRWVITEWAGRDGDPYPEAIERLPHLLAHVEEYRNIWKQEDAALSASEAALASGSRPRRRRARPRPGRRARRSRGGTVVGQPLHEPALRRRAPDGAAQHHRHERSRARARAALPVHVPLRDLGAVRVARAAATRSTSHRSPLASPSVTT